MVIFGVVVLVIVASVVVNVATTLIVERAMVVLDDLYRNTEDSAQAR
jgi:hypothetical protein